MIRRLKLNLYNMFMSTSYEPILCVQLRPFIYWSHGPYRIYLLTGSTFAYTGQILKNTKFQMGSLYWYIWACTRTVLFCTGSLPYNPVLYNFQPVYSHFQFGNSEILTRKNPAYLNIPCEFFVPSICSNHKRFLRVDLW